LKSDCGQWVRTILLLLILISLKYLTLNHSVALTCSLKHIGENEVCLYFILYISPLALQLHKDFFIQNYLGINNPELLRLKVLYLKVSINHKAKSRHLAGTVTED
jgi:hypothetical protein